MSPAASAVNYQGEQARGRREEIARLPLQVGTTAHWSFTRAPIPAALAVALAIGLPQLAASWEIEQTEDVVGLVLLGLLALTCAVFTVLQLRRAVTLRASDLVVTPGGIEVQGGREGGARLSWEALTPPYAEVEETQERRLSALGAILFVGTLFRAGTPIARATVWRLWLHVGGKARAVGVCDRQVEAQSMEAAAASISAVKEGRRRVAEAPSVSARAVTCGACGAAVAPRDAPEVACAHCGASVALDAEARKQAAASAAMETSRERVSKIAARLLRQPRGARTNRRLAALWALMVIPWPPTIALFFYHRGRELEVAPLGLDPWFLWAAPPAVMVGAWALGRALLASRGAFQLLTLGFGALAPEQEGEPARCRRCHGPLGHGAAGGVVACEFCESDNILGIDPRPFVDKARAEEKTLDRVLGERRRARLFWGVLGAFGVACALAAGAGLVAAAAAL